VRFVILQHLEFFLFIKEKERRKMKSNTVSSQTSSLLSTKKLVIIALLSALAYALMLIHLPFKYLGFLELEFSDIPAVIAALQFGPLAGVLVELIKNLIKALTASTTGMIGELANFLISSAYMISVGILYKLRMKKKSNATAGSQEVKAKNGAYMIMTFTVGIIAFATAGALLNYYVMLPLYAKFLGGIDAVVGMASNYLSAIKNLSGMVIIGITPWNIFKGIYISIIGYYIYRFLKGRVLD
jgi:riboflavin transporter FmnP